MRGGPLRAYLRLSGAIFAIVALGHAARLLFRWHVVLAGWTVPMWLSWVAITVAGFLALWAFGLAFRLRR